MRRTPDARNADPLSRSRGGALLDLIDDLPEDPAQLDSLQSACARIMGRTAHDASAGQMTLATDHPFADILNAGRKVVFSRTLKDGRLGQHHHRRWYIVEGVLPQAPATTLSFWICPATLVFDRASDLTTDINMQGWSFQLFLDAIERSGPDEHGDFEWILSGDHLSIGLSAPGFTQYLRRAPIHTPRYWLSADERRGFSFDQRGYSP